MSAGTTPRKKRAGGYVRLVNLSSQTVNAEYAGRALGGDIEPGQSTSFSLTRPQTTAMIVKTSDKKQIKLDFEIKGQEVTHSFYVLDGKGGLELKLIEGDPNTAEAGGVAANVVNLSPSKAEVRVNSGQQMTVEAGKNQGFDGVAIGLVNVETTIDGKKLETVSQGAEAKQAYSFVIHMKNGKPQVTAFLNNPPMQFSMAGSSAAG